MEEQTEPQPEPKQKPLFQEFVKAAGWTEADGPTPGVFLNKPAGHKCIWSCKWGTRFGLVEPGQLVDMSDMTDIQILHEASDCSQRGNAEIGQALMSVTPDNAWRQLATLRSLITAERFTYPEFINPDLPPPRERLGLLRLRPGWGEVKEVYAKVMEV
jgi:hypothetical protein